MKNKKNKDYVISSRYTEDEYLDILMKVSDGDGNPMMKPSAFVKAASLSSGVKIVDSELEKYKVFIAAKVGNNLNQIAKRLNTDNKSGVLNDRTYIDVLNDMSLIKKELNELLEPIRQC